MKKKTILFFADRLPPCIGGMEMHAYYFIEHFKNHVHFPLIGTVTKNEDNRDCLITEVNKELIELKDLPKLLNPSIIFFNSGRWIEELETIKELFPQSIFVYRTGGNEILKAPLIHTHMANHFERQCFWARILNQTIDFMITNSAYTEFRLNSLGITCPLIRCMGGVNSSLIKTFCSTLDCAHSPNRQNPLIIFCAARFVPYKNHRHLITVFHELIKRGHNIRLKLAGNGPLLENIQEQVRQLELSPLVDFLGILSNQQTCQEIANANIYMQLSSDKITEVPGGSYTHSECMGRSILEALTAGTFVIAGKGGALEEVVTKERGLLVEVDQIESMINQIDQVLNETPKKLPFLNDYSWDNIFKKYEEVFS